MRTRTLPGAVVWAILLWAGASAFAGAGPAKTVAESGDYQVAWLQLEQGGVRIDDRMIAPIDVPLFLGIRSGKAVTAWFSHPAMAEPRIVWLDASTLRLDASAMKGELTGRTCLNWGNKTVHDFRYTFDATVREGKLSGSFTARFTGDDASEAALSGGVTSRIIPAGESVRIDSLAPGQDWPHYYGSGFQFRGPDSRAKLIENLAEARPVWKSEAFVPTAYGSAPDARYYDRAGRTDSGGGSSSPVVSGGRVYQFFYSPSGPVGLDKAYLRYEDEADVFARARELFPKREVQQRAVVNHFRTQADETLVCLDAATGRTLWRTVLPARGNNYQTHKHRGHFPVPLIAKGVVYQPGTTGRLYALDAHTGALMWEYPDADPEPYITKQGGIDCDAPAPVLVDGVVVFAKHGGLVGVDARTGKETWKTSLWSRSSLLVWTQKSRRLVIASDRDHPTKQNFAVAVAPADGRIVWRQPVDYLIDYTFPVLAGNRLVGYSLKAENVKPGENDGLAVIHAYELTDEGLKAAWVTPPLAPVIDTVGMAANDRHVYVTAASQAFCLDLATGQTVSRADEVGGARTQIAFLAGARLFLQPEGRHGSQSFFQLDANPASFRALGSASGAARFTHPVGKEKQWAPPHSWTTAYANQPLISPVVDGRLFVRGLDALYCYDLRDADRSAP